MINPNSININRAILFCNVYHLFYAAAKASLFPFLTLFYRHLGLSAVQVGYLMAAKMLSAFLWASVCAQQAIRLRRRRFYLFLSLTMMMATNLSVWFVAASIDDNLQTRCAAEAGDKKVTIKPEVINHKIYANFTSASASWLNSSTNQSVTRAPFSNAATNSTTIPIITVPTLELKNHFTNETNATTIASPTILTTYPTIHFTTEITKPTNATTERTNSSLSMEKNETPKTENTQRTNSSLSIERNETAKTENTQRRNKRTVIDTKESTSSDTPDISYSSLFSNNSWDVHMWWLQFKAWTISIIAKESTRVFLVVLLIIIIGEPVASASEKLADDSWYDLLDCIDRLEKYGKHRIWTSIAFFMVPTMIGYLVENTKCILPFQMNHILIHCFAFAIFLGLSIILTLMLPMPLNTKLVSSSRIKKGVEITCFGCNGFVYMTTVFFMGASYSTVSNFLFWLIEDLGGHEGVMGLCIMVGTFSEFPILLYGEYLVKRMGTRAVITMSMFFFSIRVLIYTFVYSAWFILPLELFHAFTHTALWYAVFSNPVFNVSPEIDRSIRNILSSAYFGIGFSVGSLISGYIVDYWDLATLYRIVAAFCIVWSIVFFIIDRYMPRRAPVKYQRLLQAEEEEGDSDDSTAAVESDWLEQALKES